MDRQAHRPWGPPSEEPAQAIGCRPNLANRRLGRLGSRKLKWRIARRNDFDTRGQPWQAADDRPVADAARHYSWPRLPCFGSPRSVKCGSGLVESVHEVFERRRFRCCLGGHPFLRHPPRIYSQDRRSRGQPDCRNRPRLTKPHQKRRSANSRGKPGQQITVAGWSSPVAREAHNLEVAGSNPAPATLSQAQTAETKKLP